MIHPPRIDCQFYVIVSRDDWRGMKLVRQQKLMMRDALYERVVAPVDPPHTMHSIQRFYHLDYFSSS